MVLMFSPVFFFFFFSSRRRHTRFDCDWSSDVCSSDLSNSRYSARVYRRGGWVGSAVIDVEYTTTRPHCPSTDPSHRIRWLAAQPSPRSEEHTSELQSQSISYAVFCLKKKKWIRNEIDA